MKAPIKRVELFHNGKRIAGAEGGTLEIKRADESDIGKPCVLLTNQTDASLNGVYKATPELLAELGVTMEEAWRACGYDGPPVPIEAEPGDE